MAGSQASAMPGAGCGRRTWCRRAAGPIRCLARMRADWRCGPARPDSSERAWVRAGSRAGAVPNSCAGGLAWRAVKAVRCPSRVRAGWCGWPSGRQARQFTMECSTLRAAGIAGHRRRSGRAEHVGRSGWQARSRAGVEAGAAVVVERLVLRAANVVDHWRCEPPASPWPGWLTRMAGATSVSKAGGGRVRFGGAVEVTVASAVASRSRSVGRDVASSWRRVTLAGPGVRSTLRTGGDCPRSVLQQPHRLLLRCG